MSIEGQDLGIYRIGAELGRGGMGTVYKAEATEDGPAGPAGTTVAIKTIHPQLVEESENAFQRFQLEAQVGMRIAHANVVRTYAVDHQEIDGLDCHYIVMEFIEGQTLKGLIEELGTVPDHLIYQIADQALDALHEIHENGVVHRDIKPENIVITPDHRVLLMDLGVARIADAQRALTHAGEFVGSLPYAAPEQFLRPDDVGPRSDLYAFGLVMFELATGKSPYADKDLNVLLQEKLQADVPRAREYFPDLDAFLDEAIATCVAKEPSERFSTCGELRTILEQGESSEWWQLQTTGVVVPSVERALKRLRLEREAPLVGRAAEIGFMRSVHEAARREGRLLFVGGPSGAGKSRLVYEFVEEVGSAGGPAVAAGRCVGGGGRAYQAFAEAVADLLSIDDPDPSARRASLEARLGELLSDTPGVVGSLAEFLLGVLQPGVESGFSKDAFLASFSNLLRRLAAERPVVLTIEDLHLAGAESVELLGYLSRCLAGHPLFLVAVFANDEVEEGSPLDELVTKLPGEDQVETLELTPLPFDATEELIRAVVGHEKSVRALSRVLHDRSDGNPHIVLEMVSHLKESGDLVPAGDVYELAGEPDEITVPATVRELVRLKLGRLDEDQRETLEAAAVLGFQFEASLLASVLEEKRIKLLKRLAGLERKHRLLASSGKNAFRFASRQLYEAIYDSITPALRTEYHAVVADVILEDLEEEEEQPKGETAYALMRHLYFAERADEIEPYVEEALEFMDQSFHASFAAPFLEKIDDALADAEPPGRFAIAMRLWAFYELLGKRKEQLRVLESASALADAMGEAGPRGRVHSCMAATAFYTGKFDVAGTEAEQGLTLAREAGDRKWESNALHALGGVAWHQGDLQRAADNWRNALEIRREIGDRRGEASTLLALGIVMPSLGEADKVLETQEEALAICRDIGERRVENSLLMSIANRLVNSDQNEEALSRYQDAVEIARELGDQRSEGYVLCNLGESYRALGRIDDARKQWERALGIFRDIENANGVMGALIMLGGALAKFGETKLARVHLEEAIELAGKIGAKARLGKAHRFLGELVHAGGDHAGGWKHLEAALDYDTQTKRSDSQYHTLLVMGDRALDEQDYARAVDCLRQAHERVEGGVAVGSAEVLLLARLARALKGKGDEEEALECARRAQEMLNEREPPSEIAPEIHYRLWEVLGDEARNHLTAAQATLTAHTQSIKNAKYREHFMTRAGANPEIVTMAKKILGEDD